MLQQDWRKIVELRPYQLQLVDDIRNAFRQCRRVIAVASTGAGKTVVFAYIAASAAKKGRRIVIVAHREEIVFQISNALDRLGVRNGMIKPGRTMTDDKVQVGMIQTLARRIDRIQEPDLIVIDECHHSPAGQWKIVTDRWSRALHLGVTATPTRTDGRGLGECFDLMVHAPPMRDLIDNGFLADYDYFAPPQQVDLSGVKTRGGDFAIDQLAEAMDRAVVIGDAAEHAKRHLNGEPAVVFCVTVAHAEHVAEQFRAAGFRAAAVDGSMEKTERRDRIAAIGDGRLNILTSCSLISEGTDLPGVKGVILLRPTKSVSLYLQMVGRALRPKPDGSRAVILDHVNNVHRHGLPDAPREWTLDTAKCRGQSPNVTTCDQCYRTFKTGPGWKAEAECANGQPEGCVLNIPEAPAGGKEAPETVAGELIAVTVTPGWADGLNIATCRGPDFAELLNLAGADAERLKQIAKARGYHHRWVFHRLKAIGQRANAA